MPAQILPYASARELAVVLGIADIASDPDLLVCLTEAAELIVERCGRDFHLRQETRTWDVPIGPTLVVDDLLEIAADGVHLFGTVLTDNEWFLVPTRLRWAYGLLLRLDAGLVVDWDRDAGVRNKRQQIQITGTWGYDGTKDGATWIEVIPARVSRANLMLAAHLWTMRDVAYTGSGGQRVTLGSRPQPPGLWTPEIDQLLNPLVRQPVPIVVGA